MELIKARDISPTTNHITVVAGPPGLGKSYFCGSIGEVIPPEEVLLIGTLEREVKSVLYQKYDYDTVLCADDDWNPARKAFRATGYQQLIDTLEELRDDTKYSAVILDSGTEAGELAWHDALSTHGVATASAIKGGSFPAYDKMSTNMEQIVRSIAKLAGRVISQVAHLSRSPRSC